ncbi:hypothetical protein ACFL26_01420 [Patescibacteria group bacterium]
MNDWNDAPDGGIDWFGDMELPQDGYLEQALRGVGCTDAELERLAGNPEMLEAFFRVLKGDSVIVPAIPGPPPGAPVTNGLVHGRFTPLDRKLELVRSWPGVTGDDIDRALRAGRAAIDLFNRESAGNQLLDLVVCRYLPTAWETLSYARDRMREAHGDRFWQWGDAYGSSLENRVRYLKGITAPTSGLRVEVVDLGANFDPANGTVPTDVRGPASAHAAVVYAAAQDPEWVRQADGRNVPYALAAGFELDVPGFDRWSDSPYVCRLGVEARLSAHHLGDRYHSAALPSLREC